ncbi:MAG: pitrilysin family protein [Chloroflexota bacterium]
MHQKVTLDNGLRVITTTMPQVRSVSISIFIGVGSRYETAPQGGISHFIEHLLFKGTARRPTSREISEAIEGIGGIVNAGTDKELTVYWCKVASPHFSAALDVLVDMLFNSKFDPVEMERERQVVIEEINQSKDSPHQQVNTLIDELLWPEHPLGRDTAGSKESMSALTRDMVLDYLHGQYLPADTVVAIGGNIEPPEAEAAIRQAMGQWSNRQPLPEYLHYQGQLNPRLKIEKRDIEQSHLCLALPGLSLVHPRRFTLDLLNVILGEGMSSRLFIEVRDKLGLAYAVHSYADHFLDTGSVIVYAGVDPRKLDQAVRAILEQLKKLEQPVPANELTKAKEMAKGRLLLRMEDSHNVASWTGGQEVLAGRILTIDDVIARIDAITAEEIAGVAREVFISNQLRLAVVGPVTDDGHLEKLLYF